MFFKTKKSSIFTKSNSFPWVIRHKNRRKTKKWFISFKFDWILKLWNHTNLVLIISLCGSWGLNYLRWSGGRVERCGAGSRFEWAQCRRWLLSGAEDILGAVTFPPSREFHFQLVPLIPYSAIVKTNPRHIPYFSYFYPCGKSTFKTTIITKNDALF